MFITTNHKEYIDDALLRAGRLDYHFELDELTKEQKKELVESILDEIPYTEEFMSKIYESTTSSSSRSIY